MPKQQRWTIKRGIDQAIGNIEKAQLNLAQVGNQFEGPHPDIYIQFSAIVSALACCQDAAEALRESI